MPEDDGDELILEDNVYDDNDNDNDSEEDVNEEDGINELEDMSDAEWESVLDSTAEELLLNVYSHRVTNFCHLLTTA